MRLINCILFWSILNIVNAQNNLGITFTTNSSTESAVLIKWLEPTLFEDNETFIYRKKENSSDWKLLTEQPITMETDLNFLDDYPGPRGIIETVKETPLTEDERGIFEFVILNEIIRVDSVAQYLGLFYKDTTAEEGETYEYKVTTRKRNKEVLIGISEPLKVEPFKSFQTVEDIIYEVDENVDSLVNIRWKPDSDRYFGVNIWRTDVATNERVLLTSSPILPSFKGDSPNGIDVYNDWFYTDKTARIGKKYLYELVPVNYFYQSGTASDPHEIILVDHSPAPLPFGFEVDAIDRKKIIIHWTDIPTEKVKGINVMVQRSDRGFKPANATLLAPDATEFTYILPEYGSYYFKLHVLNHFDSPSETHEKAIDYRDIDPPVIPTNLQVVADTGKVKISWDENMESDLKGYIVFRGEREDMTVPFQRITSEPLTINEFVNKLPKRAKNKFFYKIAAVDTLLNMSELTEPVSIKLPDVIPPEAPVLKKASSTTINVIVEWLPFFEDDFESCEVYRFNKTAGDQDWKKLTTLDDENQLSYKDNTVEPNTDYQYKIRASDDTGNWSEFSNIYNVRTKPDNTPAEGANKISTSYQKKKKEVTIKWKENEPNRKGSVVFRKKAGGRLIAVSPMINGKAVYVDKKVSPGNTYTYVVKTYYDNGRIGASDPEELVVQE